MADDRGAFIWYELMTPDPSGAKAFYDAVVGWRIDTASAVPGGEVDYRMIKRSDGGNVGGMLAMSQDMLDHGGKPGWFGYVDVRDVDSAAQAMVDAGGAIHMGPQDMEGVGRMAMVADPWGASLYMMTPTPPADKPDAKSDVFSVTKAQHVRWNELWSTDQDGAVALYSRLFGWTQEGAMPMGPMGDYLFIQQGCVGIGAIAKAQPGGEGSRWQYFIGVDDIDRACGAVVSGGGELLGDPQQIPGGEFSVYAHDPQGATFGLVGPRKVHTS
jgi:predicted enzyme related to lactoylglutathione lyase